MKRPGIHWVAGIWVAVAALVFLETGAAAAPSLQSVMAHKDVDPAYQGKPHVVFFIHGLLGNADTFGDFGQLLGHRYESVQNLHVVQLTYPSAPNQEVPEFVHELHPYSFAKIINTRMISYLIEQGAEGRAECIRLAREQKWSLDRLKECQSYVVGLDTPYSFIAHSQGALVAMVYLNTCLRAKGLMNRCQFDEGRLLYERVLRSFAEAQNIRISAHVGDPDPTGASRAFLENEVQNALIGERLFEHSSEKANSPSPPQMRNFFSLGAPFYGSPVANSTAQGQFLRFMSNKLPARQIQQLAIGSPGLTWQRVLMLNRKTSLTQDGDWTNPYPQDLKIFNFAGMIPDFTLFKFFKFEHPKDFEQDVVVSAPEARLDFLYYLESPQDPNAAPIQGITNAVSDYYPLDLIPHLEVGGRKPGVARVTYADYQDHPSFQWVATQLDRTFGWDKGVPGARPLKSEATLRSQFADNLRNFTSEIKLATPIGYHRTFPILRKNVQIRAGLPHVFDQLVKKDPRFLVWDLLLASGSNRQAEKISEHFYQTYYHIGSLRPEYGFRPRVEDFSQFFVRSSGGYDLAYHFRILGFENKTFVAPVLAGITSYAEVMLKPFHPIAPTTAITRVGDSRSCRLGIMGSKTPKRAKFNEMTPEDRALNGGSDSVRLDSKILTREQLAVQERLWKKYAQNQALTFSSLSDTMEQGQSLASLETGAILEVLGRVQAHDRSGKPVDRYLITTPELRQRDGVRRFSDISIQKGTRWVNVVDVDLFKDDELVGISFGTGTTPGNVCIADSNRNDPYLHERAQGSIYGLPSVNRALYSLDF